ncbi:MAG TPA: heptaprenyl diphosphate synthase [Lachnospiraceae bacterium]|nr:heptaprenyl diphosphate synthase [Lachnospiraceae bacterium]
MSAKRTAYLGMLLAASLIIGYIESLLPPLSGIPGVKLGLSNITTLITMELFGRKEALTVLVLRIILSGLLFGNLFSIIFSLCGGLCAFLAMAASGSISGFSIIGVSMLGGSFHNIGQLIAAVFMVKGLRLQYYGPVLMVSGLFTGFFIGFLTKLILLRINNNRRTDIVSGVRGTDRDERRQGND